MTNNFDARSVTDPTPTIRPDATRMRFCVILWHHEHVFNRAGIIYMHNLDQQVNWRDSRGKSNLLHWTESLTFLVVKIFNLLIQLWFCRIFSMYRCKADVFTDLTVVCVARIALMCFVYPQAPCMCLWPRPCRWEADPCRKRRSGPSWISALKASMNSSAEVNRHLSHTTVRTPTFLKGTRASWLKALGLGLVWIHRDLELLPDVFGV